MYIKQSLQTHYCDRKKVIKPSQRALSWLSPIGYTWNYIRNNVLLRAYNITLIPSVNVKRNDRN